MPMSQLESTRTHGQKSEMPMLLRHCDSLGGICGMRILIIFLKWFGAGLYIMLYDVI